MFCTVHERLLKIQLFKKCGFSKSNINVPSGLSKPNPIFKLKEIIEH